MANFPLGHKVFTVILLILISLSSSSVLAATLQDPTQPADATVAPIISGQAGLALTSILISPQRRIAIINGQVVKAGDMIADMKIIQIERNQVRLQGEEGEITLQLISQEIKRAIKQPVARNRRNIGQQSGFKKVISQ